MFNDEDQDIDQHANTHSHSYDLTNVPTLQFPSEFKYLNSNVNALIANRTS